MKVKKLKTKNLQAGFSLLEMLVAIFIFSIVALIATGAVTRLFALYGQTQTMQTSIDNLNFALESISRDVRFGKFVSAGSSSESIVVDFVNMDGDTENISYYKSGDRIIRAVDGEAFNLTADKVLIDDFKVQTTSLSGFENFPPISTILIAGRIDRGAGQFVSFSMQTSISQRSEQ